MTRFFRPLLGVIGVLIIFVFSPLFSGNLENTSIPFIGKVTQEQAATVRGYALVIPLILILILVGAIFLLWPVVVLIANALFKLGNVFRRQLGKLVSEKLRDSLPSSNQRMPWLAIGNPKTVSKEVYDVSSSDSFLFEANVKILGFNDYWRAGVNLIDEKKGEDYQFHLAVGGDYPSLFFRSVDTKHLDRKDLRPQFGSENGNSNKFCVKKEDNRFIFSINEQQVDSFEGVRSWRVTKIMLSAWGDNNPHLVFFDGIRIREVK